MATCENAFVEPGFNTKASHAGDGIDDVAEQPMSPPIWQSADYAYESAEHYADVINERREGEVYGRYGSPTTKRLSQTLATLEGAEAGWVFSSGMGAIHAVLMHCAGAGAKIVAGQTLYGGTYGLFTEGARRAGIEVAFADSRDASSVERVIKGASALFVESIANPTFEIADLEGLVDVARKADVPLIVDNTVATPALLNPLALGADIVVHSTSKYIGGHHDLMGGAVLADRTRVDDVRHLAIRYGTTASSLESWLALRGLATLGIRIERHCANALTLAEMLEGHPSVERVLYPGLPSHPQHDLGRKLLRGFGGMIAIDLGSIERAWHFMGRTKIARVGSSFGGVRSELTHPASTSHRQFSAGDRAAAGITDGLVRISVGIEDLSDLLEDFEQALS